MGGWSEDPLVERKVFFLSVSRPARYWYWVLGTGSDWVVYSAAGGARTWTRG